MKKYLITSLIVTFVVGLAVMGCLFLGGEKVANVNAYYYPYMGDKNVNLQPHEEITVKVDQTLEHCGFEILYQPFDLSFATVNDAKFIHDIVTIAFAEPTAITYSTSNDNISNSKTENFISVNYSIIVDNYDYSTYYKPYSAQFKLSGVLENGTEAILRHSFVDYGSEYSTVDLTAYQPEINLMGNATTGIFQTLQFRYPTSSSYVTGQFSLLTNALTIQNGSFNATMRGGFEIHSGGDLPDIPENDKVIINIIGFDESWNYTFIAVKGSAINENGLRAILPGYFSEECGIYFYGDSEIGYTHFTNYELEFVSGENILSSWIAPQVDTTLRVVYYQKNNIVTLKWVNKDNVVTDTRQFASGDALHNSLFPISEFDNTVNGLYVLHWEVLEGVDFFTTRVAPNVNSTVRFWYELQAVETDFTRTITFIGINDEVLGTVTQEVGDLLNIDLFPTPPTVSGHTWLGTWSKVSGLFYNEYDSTYPIPYVIYENLIFKANYEQVISVTLQFKIDGVVDYSITKTVPYGSTYLSVLHDDVLQITEQRYGKNVTFDEPWQYLGQTFILKNSYTSLDVTYQNNQWWPWERSDGLLIIEPLTNNMTWSVHFTPAIKIAYVSYYSIERLYYTKQNKFLWVIPAGTEAKYVDIIVKQTHPIFYLTEWGTLEQAIEKLDELELNSIGENVYGVPSHLSVSGFEFLGWERTGNKHGKPLYTANYNIPKVAIHYHGSNGAFIETQYIDLNFVHVRELNSNLKWYEGFVKYFQDVVVKWNFVELANDIDGRSRAKEIVRYISEVFYQGEYEPLFMVIQPDVRVEAANGIFKSSSAAVSSGTFKYLMGTSANNDYVYYADLSGVYVTGLKYEARVTFDTPYDAIIGWIGDAWDWGKGLVTGGGLWWIIAIILLIFCFPLVIVLVKALLNILIAPIKWLGKKVGG